MATVRAFIRTQKNNSEKVNVRFRLTDGRDVQLFCSSELKVDPLKWYTYDELLTDKERVAHKKAKQSKPRIVSPSEKQASEVKEREKVDFYRAVNDIRLYLLEEYSKNKDNIQTSDWMCGIMDKYHHPEKYMELIVKQTFFDVFDEFLDKHKLSEVRKKNFRVIGRALRRYELYIQQAFRKDYQIDIDTFSSDDIRDLEDFLKSEHILADEEEYAKIYEVIPEKRKPLPRGQNTLNDILVKLRTFFIWACKVNKTTNNPFTHFKIEECVYGTPYYITIEERNQLYNTDFSDTPELAVQRDIFVFQCLIGCRVGDFYRMTKSNVINGAIEYIARKTKDGRPVTVRVPLNGIAREILARYEQEPGERLFPFVIEQYYNESIKAAFLKAGLTRMVTVINQTTREEEKRPLNELASSHLARRCFVGNLYKKVKDPNLVGALSGHKEGSKAFARYREIDEDIKNQLVKMLE